MLRLLHNILDNMPQRTFLIIEFIMIIILGYVDHFTGPQFSFSIFYLIPISLAAWYSDKTITIAVSMLCGISWLLADLTTINPYLYTHPFIYYWNAIMSPAIFFIIAILLSNLQKLIEREKRTARIDSLTGIANSRGFREYAFKELARAKRYNHPITLAYIDVDNFKTINDTYGHIVGDELLIEVSKTIAANIRPADLVSRLGGDEFAILFTEIGIDAAKPILQKINNLLLTTLQKKQWPVTFSVGVVTFENPPESIEEMIRRADNLMYEAKKGGKDTVRYEIYNSVKG